MLSSAIDIAWRVMLGYINLLRKSNAGLLQVLTTS